MPQKFSRRHGKHYSNKNNKKSEEDETINKEAITINDPSFNIRYQPNEIPKEETDYSTSALFKEKLEYTSNIINENLSFQMETLLKQALFSFENFVSPNLAMEQKIPFQILKECSGIMSLSIIKGSVGFGGMLGTGIIMSRNPNWRSEWSPPCAIAIGGLQLGFNIGIEKTDSIIIIRDENVISKFHSGLRLGGDMSLAVGPLGRDINVGLTVNEKGILPNMSYSMSKGMYLGFALEGCIITVRNDCNEQYYGQKVDVSDILNGSVQAPFNSDYTALCKTFSNYMNKNESFSNEFVVNPEESDHISQEKPDPQDPQDQQDSLLKDENHPILNITSTPKCSE